jgi:hypothetical protein
MQVAPLRFSVHHERSYVKNQGATVEEKLEDDAVKTGENGDDQAGKLGDEARQRLHGVLLPKGLVQTPF